LKDSSGNIVYEKVFLGKDFENLKKLKIKDILIPKLYREKLLSIIERKRKEKEKKRKRED
jgi:hypothetical protein